MLELGPANTRTDVSFFAVTTYGSKGRLVDIEVILDFCWQYRKSSAEEIANPVIEEAYKTALRTGATGSKMLSVGSFMMLCGLKNLRYIS